MIKYFSNGKGIPPKTSVLQMFWPLSHLILVSKLRTPTSKTPLSLNNHIGRKQNLSHPTFAGDFTHLGAKNFTKHSFRKDHTVPRSAQQTMGSILR